MHNCLLSQVEFSKIGETYGTPIRLDKSLAPSEELAEIILFGMIIKLVIGCFPLHCGAIQSFLGLHNSPPPFMLH